MPRKGEPFNNDVTAAARAAAGKIQNDPALTAIQELTDSMKASVNIMENESKLAREEAAAVAKAAATEVETLKSEIAAGFKVLGDKTNALERRQMVISGGFRDVAGNCLAAIAQDDRHFIPMIAMTIKKATRDRRDDFPILSTAEGASLTALLLHASLKLQRRMFRSQQEEIALWHKIEKYTKALADSFGIEIAAMLTTTGDSGGLGGHWLPEPVANELYRLITDNSLLSGRCSHVAMTTKSLDLPVEGSSSLNVSWGTEGATNITDSVPSTAATNKVTLTAGRLNGWAESSIEEVQDSPISIMGWVLQKLTEQAGREIDAQILGEGATAQFTGLRTAVGVNEVGGSGANGVPFATFQLIMDQVYKARERSTREEAVFVVSPETMAKIAGMRADAVTGGDGAGAPLFQWVVGLPGSVSRTIAGYEAIVHSVVKADRTYGTGTGHSTIYFGPLSQVVIGDRMGMSWDVSDLPNFRQATIQMRLITRLAIGVAVPAAFSRHSNMKVV